jgi:hypothetical protein
LYWTVYTLTLYTPLIEKTTVLMALGWNVPGFDAETSLPTGVHSSASAMS